MIILLKINFPKLKRKSLKIEIIQYNNNNFIKIKKYLEIKF